MPHELERKVVRGKLGGPWIPEVVAEEPAIEGSVGVQATVGGVDLASQQACSSETTSSSRRQLLQEPSCQLT